MIRNIDLPSPPKITLGVSACLLGESVRFNGGHKRDDFVAGALPPFFQFHTICPEIAIGMGTPRPPIQLKEINGTLHLLNKDRPDEINVTEKMVRFSHETAPTLHALSGYIFKNKSPSCGIEKIPVYGEHGQPIRHQAGIYAEIIQRAHPNLPIEDEGRLNDPVIRENFIERVFVYARWQALIHEGLTMGKLVEFHSRHKYQIMSHSQAAYKSLGAMIANHDKLPLETLALLYPEALMQALQHKATPKNHTNTLMHILGYLKTELTLDDKQEMLQILDHYRTGKLPLIVPITLLKHYFRKYPDRYIAKQYYLEPHPAELMLRNHV
ncbi:MAG: DUF1722 domain-containing protein [Zetaproteobacteria bacterium]|nr:DUF1722 domain-containing protein [Zetaproteobacteria bacterium]